MKKKLYLHIGTGKTGTTAIQNYCFLNQDLLRLQGYHYLECARWEDNSHHKIGFALWGAEYLGLPNIPNENWNDLQLKIKKEVSTLPESVKSVIVSSELLFEYASHENFNAFVTFLKSVFKEVKIVCYVRNQAEHLESLYKHWLATEQKEVKHQTIEEFIESFDGDFYDKFLSEWAGAFGYENMLISIYEKKEHPKQFLSEFASLLGINDTQFKLPKPFQSNKSLSNEAVAIIKNYPWFSPYYVAKYLTEVGNSNTRLFSNKQREKIKQKYEASNRRLSELFFDGNPVFKSENPLTANETIAQADLSEASLKIAQGVAKDLKKALETLERANKKIEALEQKHDQLTKLFASASRGISNRDLSMVNPQNLMVGGTAKLIEILPNGIHLESTGTDPIIQVNCEQLLSNSLILRFDLTCPAETFCQVYFNTEQESFFTERNSKVVHCKQGKSTVQFYIKLPLIEPQLRIDPGNIEGEFKLENIALIPN